MLTDARVQEICRQNRALDRIGGQAQVAQHHRVTEIPHGEDRAHGGENKTAHRQARGTPGAQRCFLLFAVQRGEAPEAPTRRREEERRLLDEHHEQADQEPLARRDHLEPTIDVTR